MKTCYNTIVVTSVHLIPLLNVTSACVKSRDAGLMPFLAPLRNEVKSLIKVSCLCNSLSPSLPVHASPIRIGAPDVCVFYYLVCYWKFANRT
jgi:hypothetical protein